MDSIRTDNHHCHTTMIGAHGNLFLSGSSVATAAAKIRHLIELYGENNHESETEALSSMLC